MSDDKWHPGKRLKEKLKGLDSKKQQDPSSPPSEGTPSVKPQSGKDGAWYPGYVKDKMVTKFHKEIGNLKNHVKQKRELRREKFEEAVAGMPGSGMMKPKKPIGYLQIESELTLSSSVVQAYLRNAPFYDAVDDELESDAENKEGDKFDPRILKRNISRLKYAVGGPPLLLYLCGFPQCGLLLPLHFYLCFAA
eukprot:gene29692-37010_t